MDKGLRNILLSFGSISVLMLGLSLFLIISTTNFLGKAHTVKGEVVSLLTSYDEEGDESYAPVVTYCTIEGKQLIYMSSNYSYPAAYEKGELIDIYYDPEEPKSVKLPRFFSLWGGALITGIFGLLFAAVVITVIIINRRTK